MDLVETGATNGDQSKMVKKVLKNLTMKMQKSLNPRLKVKAKKRARRCLWLLFFLSALV